MMVHEGISGPHCNSALRSRRTGHKPSPTPHTLCFSGPYQPTRWACAWYGHFWGPAAKPWVHTQFASKGVHGDLSCCDPSGHALANLSSRHDPEGAGAAADIAVQTLFVLSGAPPSWATSQKPGAGSVMCVGRKVTASKGNGNMWPA